MYKEPICKTDDPVAQRIFSEVIRGGICTSCGACVLLDSARQAEMVDTAEGPRPSFAAGTQLTELAWDVCPGKGLNYPEQHRLHYGSIPKNGLVGPVVQTRTGHASDNNLRRVGASGGVTTAVLAYLLETGRVDGAVVVKQGTPTPEKARSVIVKAREELLNCVQSVYVPVSCLDRLADFEPGKRYAMTLTSEQSAGLRALQLAGHAQAQQVAFVLGPYTGTALYPAAIPAYLRSKGVAKDDAITSLKWRAGEWPGYLEIKTASGKILRSKKIYYNFLIPFFVTQTSLQSMDFANEFADLAVGDAWSPMFESLGQGFSVMVTRSPEMEAVIELMTAQGLLTVEKLDNDKASDMHGHMIDFKKRGGYLRNQWRYKTGRKAPDYHMRPDPIPASRIAVEIVIGLIFAICRTGLARWILIQIPEFILGPLFNQTRLTWKALSKPTKRKGLGSLNMVSTEAEKSTK